MEDKILEAYYASIEVVKMVEELVKNEPPSVWLKHVNLAYDVVIKLEEVLKNEVRCVENV